jgi:hypothetical protein
MNGRIQVVKRLPYQVIGQLHASAALPPGNNLHYTFDKGLCSSQNLSGHSCIKRNHCSLRELNLDSPAVYSIVQSLDRLSHADFRHVNIWWPEHSTFHSPRRDNLKPNPVTPLWEGYAAQHSGLGNASNEKAKLSSSLPNNLRSRDQVKFYRTARGYILSQPPALMSQEILPLYTKYCSYSDQFLIIVSV